MRKLGGKLSGASFLELRPPNRFRMLGMGDIRKSWSSKTEKYTIILVVPYIYKVYCMQYIYVPFQIIVQIVYCLCLGIIQKPCGLIS